MKKNLLITIFLVMGSSNLIVADSKPIMSRVYGDQFVPEADQTQSNGPIGAFNETFATGGYKSIDSELAGSKSNAIQVLPDGTFLVTLSKAGSNAIVAKYNSDGMLLDGIQASPNYGTLGLVDLGASTDDSRVIMLDVQGRALVAGGDGSTGSGWLKRIGTDGTIDTSFATSTSWGYIQDLAEQSTGKIITVGSDGTNAQVARYNLDGTLDTTFGASGFVVLNGSASGAGTLPTATTGLYSVVVNASNQIYLSYQDSVGSATHVMKLTSVGILDSSWATSGIASISYLDGATSPLFMAIDFNDNLVVAAQDTLVINVTAIASSTGGAASPVFTDTQVSSSGNNLTITRLLTTTDGASDHRIIIVGSNATTIYSRITQLLSTGGLDTAFNAYDEATNPGGVVGGGYNEFQVASGTLTNSQLTDLSIAPLGQIYTSGFQIDAGGTIPYVYNLYNEQNVYEVSQAPAVQEQGILDQEFGFDSFQTYSGVVTPINGLYRANLLQQAESVIELASGKILVGLDGKTDSTDAYNMMLVRLTSQGILDSSFGVGGKLLLPNITTSNEHLTDVFEDGSFNIYVSGYYDSGAIFRKYTSAGVLIWESDFAGAGYKGLSVGLEGANRALLFMASSATTGQINGYNVTTGTVDTTFHSTGGSPGSVLTTDFGLNMGPIHNGVVDSSANIYIAYKNTTTGNIDVAAFFNAAPSLIAGFGSGGVVSNVFSGATISDNNIRIALDENGNLIVAAATATEYLVTTLVTTDGLPYAAFNGGVLLSIPVSGANSLNIQRLTGVSDLTLMITGYDNNADDTMLVSRVTGAGVLDVTFNSQGSQPGILPIQIGDELEDYYARVASSLLVQSFTGINQGNLIISGYEQMFATTSTPMVMRVFGTPGTTEVKSSPVSAKIPGTFDPTYDNDGVAETYANGESDPTANQSVRALRQLPGVQIMTVVSDDGTSWTLRLNSDSSIDTSYGGGLGIEISQRTGSEVVNNMVFNGVGNMLIVGENSTSGGFLKCVLPTGAMSTLFGGLNEDPIGTVYGLMSNISSVAELNNGNIVIVGTDNGVGKIAMLTSAGDLLTTFGSAGYISIGTNVSSISVDASNDLYACFGSNDGGTLYANIVKLDENGSFVGAFGSAGRINNTISSIDNDESIRLVFDENQNLIIAATFGGASGEIGVRRYTSAGIIDTTFNSGNQLDVVFTTPTNLVLTGLIALQNNKILFSGYQQDDATPTNNQEYIGCIDALGNMDGSFGNAAPGLVTFQVAGSVQLARQINNMNTQFDGKILMAGNEVPATDESTPLTFRMYGYTGFQAVPQFGGYEPTVPTVLDPYFDGDGIAFTPEISNLIQGGPIVVNAAGKPIIGGVTSDNQFILARFLNDGTLDPDFGTDGIASVTVPTLSSGGYVALDSLDRIFISGRTSDSTFVVAVFDTDGIIDTDFAGVGYSYSNVITNLVGGGFIVVDKFDKPIIAGYTSDSTIVAVRFTAAGVVDSSFGTSNIASVSVATLLNGGYVIGNDVGNVYVGGMTTDENMFIAKFDNDGIIITTFGTLSTGIAYSGVITDLAGAGALKLDSIESVCVGGYTLNQQFVLTKFLADGTLAPFFGTAGITYSDPVSSLSSFGDIVVDSNDAIIIGGTISNYDQSLGMVVAKFTVLGNLDIIFSPTGMGTTGGINGLESGGYVAINQLDNVYIGGLTSSPSKLVVAKTFSGEEIFISSASDLSADQLVTFFYGNNRGFLRDVLSVLFLSRRIADETARANVIIALNEVIENYILIYEGKPGWNLVWHFYRTLSTLAIAEAILIAAHAGSTAEIAIVFEKLAKRIRAIRLQ